MLQATHGVTLIPLKTLTTRVMDLLHKQLRKPLESLSPYFRYTQLLQFDSSLDQVRDIAITHGKCERNGVLMIAYQMDSKYLMVVE